jgi:hypothetical protein
MDPSPPALTARFWRTRRSAAIAGIVFAVLLLTALTMMRLALGDADPRTLQFDSHRRALIRVGLHLVPFAGIAFLWFIGVVRDQLGPVEDRLISTVFLGIGTTQTLVSVYAMRMAAVFTLSVSTVGLRTSAFPRWISYLGYVIALVLLLAAGEHKWTQLLFPAWVLLLSVVILLTGPTLRAVSVSASD